MSAVKTATRLVQGNSAERFEAMLGNAVREIAELGLVPQVSISHVMQEPNVLHYAGVVSGSQPAEKAA